MRSRFLVVLAAVIFMIAAFVAPVFAESIEQSIEYGDQVKIVNSNPADFKSVLEVEADPVELSNFYDIMKQHREAGIGMVDNATAWYSIGSPTIYANAGDVIYPMSVQIYTDIARASIWWDYYIVSDDNNTANLSARLVDESYNALTDYVQFDSVGWNLWRARFFELPLAYIMRPSSNNIVMIEFNTTGIAEYWEGVFYTIPTTVRTLPGTPYVWPSGNLEGSVVYINEPIATVEVNQNNIIPQTLTPGMEEVSIGAGSITANVNSELRSTRLEIHWSNQNDSLYLLDWLHNIKVVFDNGESTVAVELQNFTLTPSHYAYYNFVDYFSFLPLQTRSFEILVSCDEQPLSDQVWVVLGNTEDRWCFSSTSFKNLENNQWIINIMPQFALNWPAFTIAPVMLRVSCVNNPGVQTAINGDLNQDFVDFACTAINDNITVDFFRSYGFIQGSLESDSLYVCRDYLDSLGYLYVNNIAENLRLYDITTDPGMTVNLNSTAESFASTTGAATFSNMSWTIPNGETHIMRVVGDIDNNAYQYVLSGNKWFKVDIVDPDDIEAHDSFGNRVYITDANGGPWDYGIDGNGNSLPYPENTTSHIIQICNNGELYITSEANPASDNVIAGASNVLMLRLKALTTNAAYEIRQVPIFQADSLVYSRSVESVKISYFNQSGQQTTVTATMNINNGTAYLDLNATPWFRPANSVGYADIFYNLDVINQTLGAYAGDRIKAGFDADQIIAKNLATNQFVYQTTNNVDIIGNEMIVYGNVPVVNLEQPTTSLVSGPNEIRYTISAAEGGTDLFIGQVPLMFSIIDAMPTTAELRLCMFQVWEGDSYTTAVPLAGGMTSGTDSYNVFGPNGQGLYFSGSYLAPNGGINQLVLLTFFDDRRIPAGTTKYYIVRFIVQNVNSGGPGDGVSYFMYDGDMQYLPPMGADFSPESAGMIGACLDSPNLSGQEVVSYFIWSDGTGTLGYMNHVQASYNGTFSSQDWFCGYLLKNLNIVRTLTATAIDGESSTIEIPVPTKFEAINAPNPFNPTTAIRYTLAEPANVSLTIYDILGREVARLVDNQYQYAGYFEYQWNASYLSSGVYFYRLVAGENVATGKMNLTK